MYRLGDLYCNDFYLTFSRSAQTSEKLRNIQNIIIINSLISLSQNALRSVLADAPEAKSRHRPQILVCLHRIHPEKSHGRPDTVTGASLSLRGRTMLRTHERDPAAASQTLQESFMFLGRTVISNPGLHSSGRCHPRERAVRLPALRERAARLPALQEALYSRDRPPLHPTRCGRSCPARVSSLVGSFATNTISIRSDTRMKTRRK